MEEKLKGEIVIFKPKNGKGGLEVRLEQETVWLSQQQMADLFQTERSVITKHINNILKSQELQKKSVCAKFAHTAKDGKTYQVNFYNLDMIISAGYRVNSKRGTQFRIWATQILKDYLVKGYSVNEKRLKGQNTRLLELQKTVNLMGRLLKNKELDKYESAGLLKVITDYSYALTILDQYDHQNLEIKKTTRKKEFILTYEKAINAVYQLNRQFCTNEEASDLFGKEKDKSFNGSLGAIYQTFDGKPLYSSIEEKAAHLLYFVTKNHSFVDGNKRIAAFLFIWYLDSNGLLYSRDGKKRIGDNALVALTLMIAESNPKDKEIIIKVIVNLINKENYS
ncbi:MAG: virulence protein RhuM/Fic/DOC family protein [Deltaproteobacteria bacterium]|nr:virulence protein RhuM/Fic/DOC family protein [Deltaproteobacteria bacterium]